MATPNLAHHNQLQLFNQQRHPNPGYAKERVQAIIQVNPFLFPLRIYFNSHSTFQRANVLRSQGFTPDNNPELQNLLRFISTLQAQQAQQNGMFPFTLHILLRYLNFTLHSPPHTSRTSKSRSISCCKWPPLPPTAGTAYLERNDCLPSKFSWFRFLPDESSSPWALHYPSLVHTGTDKRPSCTNPRI
jgi:hypothetical protein